MTNAHFLISKSDLRKTEWREMADTPLADGHVRLRVDHFALTANNVTYAVFGEAMGYWTFYPAPDGFGRVPVWGFATIMESQADGVEVGRRVYGYLPISRTFDVQPGKAGKASFVDVSAHRAALAAIYNTYIFTDTDPSYDKAMEDQQMLFRPLYTTGWMIDDSLMEGGAAPVSRVIISSASSKTALALAHCQHRRGNVDVIGLTSAGNVDFVTATGLYSKVLTYDQIDRIGTDRPAAYVDFAGNPSLTAAVHAHCGASLARSLVIGATDWETDRTPQAMTGPTPEFFFVPTYAAARAKVLGADVLNAKLGRDLAGFYQASKAILTPEHASGAEAISQLWVKSVDNDVSPQTGLILSV